MLRTSHRKCPLSAEKPVSHEFHTQEVKEKRRNDVKKLLQNENDGKTRRQDRFGLYFILRFLVWSQIN